MEPTPEIVAPDSMSSIDMHVDLQRRLAYLAAHQKQQVPWVAGDVIKLPNIQDYVKFEDRLIDFVPHSKQAKFIWEGREKIDQKITPKKFYGRVCDISLTYIDQPYDYIQAYTTGQRRDTLLNTTQTPGFAFGFILQAALSSTGRGTIGALDTFIAYAYQGLEQQKNGLYYFKSPNASSVGACGIRRVVCTPTVVTDTPLEELRESSRQTALRLKRWAMKHPYRGATETNRST